MTADAVRNLASPSFAFPTDGAARNLLGAGFANPAGNAAVYLLGAVFANPTSHTVVDRLWFANPVGYAVVNSLGARFADPASHANRNLLANRFATVLGASNLAFFAGRDPYLAADSPVRSLAANAVEVTAAMSPATGARVKAEAAPMPYQLAIAAARDDFLSAFPISAADHHRFGFGVRNANGLGNVAHLSLSDSAANVVRHFPALHFANRLADVDGLGLRFLNRNADRVVDGVGNRFANWTTNRVVHGLVSRLANWPTDSVFLSAVSSLTNRAGHRNLLLFGDSRPDVSRPGDFLLFPNNPALSPHNGVTATGITGGSSPSGTNSTVAGATTTLGPAEAGRHHCNHSCSSQQTSNDLHFSSPKKYLTFPTMRRHLVWRFLSPCRIQDSQPSSQRAPFNFLIPRAVRWSKGRPDPLRDQTRVLALLRCQDRLIGEDRLKTENLGVKKEEKVGQNVTFMPTAPAHSVKITIPPPPGFKTCPARTVRPIC